MKAIASGTYPVDAKLRRDGSWANLNPPVILGYDIAGVAKDIEPGVVNVKAGGEVWNTPEIFGNPCGSCAGYNLMPVALVACKPKTLSFVEAAAVLLAGGTAWEAVIRRLKVRPRETVLIHGGGVGSFNVQFAKAAGARALATASAKNLDVLQRLGADIAIDYQTEKAAKIVSAGTEGKRVDAAFDIEGEERVAYSQAVWVSRLHPTTTGRPGPPLPEQNLPARRGPHTRGARLEEMRSVFERGLAHSLIDSVLRLEEVSAAHNRLNSGRGRGKVVLQISPA